MKQWKSLMALHSSAQHSRFPQPPSTPSPRPSPPREMYSEEKNQQQQAVKLVGCDGQVVTIRRPVTARELMQQHPRHLVYCRSDALLIGERIPAVAPAEVLQPGKAYCLLPAHLFHSVLSFVSLASSLLLVLSAAPAASKKQHRPFELLRTDSGTLQIKFSDDFLLDDDNDTSDDAARDAKKPAVLRGDERLEKEYQELVRYGKARRWAPKLETIEEVVLVATASSADGRDRSKGLRVLPFLGKLGSRRRTTTTTLMCGNGSAVACT